MFKKIFAITLSFLLCFLFIGDVTKAATTADSEPNNDIKNANKINLNASYQGKLSAYDEDYYKYTLSKSGNVTFKLSNVYESAKMTVMDSKGETLTTLYNDPDFDGYSSTQVGLPAGTYYIAIENSSATTYEFSVNFTQSDYYEKEWNDSFRQASQIELNKTYKGLMQGSYDKDFYKFTLSTAGNVKFVLDNEDESKSITIYDKDGEEFTSFYSKEGYEGDSSINMGLPAGSYYLRVYSSDENVPYEFKLQYTKSDYYEKEWNDSFSQATSIGFNQAYTGTFQGSGDKDYYKISVPSNSKVTFELSNTGDYKNLTLYDQNGESLMYLYSDSNKSGNSTTNFDLNKGNYYIMLSGNSGDFDSYQFKVKGTFTSPAVSASQVSVVNNTGKADVITVNKLKTGDIVKVYDKSGKLLGTSKAVVSGSTSTTVSISQLGKAKGSIFVTLTSSSMKESSKKEVSFAAEKISEALKSSQIVVANNKGKNDTVTVNGLQVGDSVKVYDAKGKLLSTSSGVAKGKTSVSVSIKQLGTGKGSIQVSVTNSGKLESSKIKKDYSGEVTSAAPSVSNVSATVSMTVNKLKEGDIVKVYNEAGKVVSTSKAVAKGKTSIGVNVTKQVSKQEKFYITVTSKGAEESSKVQVYL
ncbi:pre-peptidase C-terminal domain-containing protein [Niallia taxi]|uniref:pre-peptidase C-terminal domain-containing protein n=1 Tax=Niallia taxi TaxID=2499688 RepID=UPI003D299DDF